ncbi:hypothetical protein L2E82_39912 [Cichorium intybus]|uniref:Uncharacterized protein n=1 Tax=Cichorium intybus TaxID=13427 RepID=A0ACB9AKB4_CICIN|nr:hypothetical protein L2E82_39912 [Cichorium intybus]
MQQYGSKENPLVIECFDFNTNGNHTLIGGFELNFMVAIDFTTSNGDPRRSDSLHYIDPSSRLNSYQEAIMEVREVIQVYDSDKMFPAWGFGGRMISPSRFIVGYDK